MKIVQIHQNTEQSALLNIGGKVLEKPLINRINYHFYKYKVMRNKQYGFIPQKTTIDAIMEAEMFIEPVLEKRGFVIKTSLDVKGAFEAASWTSTLHGLKEFNCPKNLYNISKVYFSNRTAVLTMNNFSETRRSTKGCPQGSFCGPGF